MATNIIDSFFVALGFKTEDAGLRKFQQQAQGVRDSILELGRVVAGVAAGGFALHKVAQIGSEFESNRIAIASFMETLGLAGDFQSGLAEAEKIMRQITTDAAKLPGEAEEYIEVFRAGLPDLKAAMPGANASDISKFTNMLTAVGRGMLKIDAGQMGRDLKLMLGITGRAGGNVRTFQELLSYMRKLPGQAGLTAESFNAMSQQARAALLQQTLATKGIKNGIDASANSFDAMWGALKSGVTQLVRLGTEGLFAGMKQDLDDLNKTFFDANGNLTETGKAVVDVLKTVGGWIRRLMRDGLEVVRWLADAAKHSKIFKAVAFGIGAYFASGAITKMVGILASIAKGFKLGALMSGLLVVGLGLLIEDIWGFYNGADSVVGILMEKYPVAFGLITSGLGAILLAFLAYKTAALIGWIQIAAATIAANLPLIAALAALGLLIFGIYELRKHWGEVLGWIEGKLNGLIDLLNAVREKLGFAGEVLSGGIIKSREHFDFTPKENLLSSGMGIMAPSATGPQLPYSLTGLDVFGGGFGAGQGPVVNNSETHVGTVQIMGNDDPKRMARGWDREVRDAQSKVGL